MREFSGKRFIALALSLILFAAVFVWDIPSSRAEEPPVQSPAPIESVEPEPTETPVETPLPTVLSQAVTDSDMSVPTDTLGSAKNLYELLCEKGTLETQDSAEPMATSGDYDYVINPDSMSVTITGYHGAGGAVTIPDTLDGKAITVIGEEAFAGTESLGSVILSNSVTSIETAAFYMCENLTSVTFGSGLQSIGAYAFEDCGLTSLNIPPSVTVIGANAFGMCFDLSSIVVDTENPNYSSDSGVLFNKLKTALLQYPAGKGGNTYSIPGSVKVITEGAFEACFYLMSGILPSGVIEIEEGAFAFCYNLERINIPSGVNQINNGTFYMCESLESLQLPNSIVSIGKLACYDCVSLPNITIPSSVTFISDYAFYYCRDLAYALFEGNAPSLGSEVFNLSQSYFTVFYKTGRTGFTNPWYGYSTSTNDPEAIYTVTFVSNGTAVSYKGLYNMIIYPPVLPIREHYIFEGWYTTSSYDKAPVTFPYKISENKTFYAKWSVELCWVSYSLIGFPMNSFKVPYGTVITDPPQPTLNGFLFSGWFPTRECNTAPVTFPFTVTNYDQYFYAKWIRTGAYLTNVSISAGKLSYPFDSGLRVYKVLLGENEPSVTLSCAKLSDVSMTINGKAVSNTTVALANGKSKTVTIKVMYGKKSNTYKFTVTRAKSGDNNLASLTNTAGVLSQPYDPNVTNYTLNLDENTSSVTLKAAKSNTMAKISPASKKLTLKNGQTMVLKFTVKAQSGAKKTYTVTVTRAPSTNTNLKTLKTSIPLSPGFSAGATDYTLTLPADKGAVTISAKAFDKLSKVTINGAKKASQKITLANGQSTMVSVVVTSQAGTAKEYRILVQRP